MKLPLLAAAAFVASIGAASAQWGPPPPPPGYGPGPGWGYGAPPPPPPGYYGRRFDPRYPYGGRRACWWQETPYGTRKVCRWKRRY